MKGSPSTWFYSQQGKENHDKIFSKKDKNMEMQQQGSEQNAGTVITMTINQGQITLSVDGGEQQPVRNIQEALSTIRDMAQASMTDVSAQAEEDQAFKQEFKPEQRRF
ncbi:MAG TPA: hypothetical protein DCS09_13915 [Porphyromonadaceae bacterium]|nr:hypothetical protein [Porphyromonadaceae bacterium]